MASAFFSIRIPPPVLPLVPLLPVLELALPEVALLVVPVADALASDVPLLFEFAVFWLALASTSARSMRVRPPVLALLLLALLLLDDEADASVLALPSARLRLFRSTHLHSMKILMRCRIRRAVQRIGSYC
jgi:hypothetical protein